MKSRGQMWVQPVVRIGRKSALGRMREELVRIGENERRISEEWRKLVGIRGDLVRVGENRETQITKSISL